MLHPLSYRRVTEKGTGWLHLVVLRTDAGATVTIADDTDEVTVWASEPDIVTPEEAAKIWDSLQMGTSTFPAIPLPIVTPTDEHNAATVANNLVWRGAGEAFSHLVH